MQNEDIRQLLEEKMNAKVHIDGEGCDFCLTVVSDQFSGLLPVKRQQMVYAYLEDMIKSGVIHAVSMRTMTYQEWENNK